MPGAQQRKHTMSFTYISQGAVIDVKVTAATTAGTPVKVAADFYGIAIRDIPANTVGAVSVEGVFSAPAAAAITAGSTVYLDNTGKLTSTAATGDKVGLALTAAASAGDIVQVHLNKG